MCCPAQLSACGNHFDEAEHNSGTGLKRFGFIGKPKSTFIPESRSRSPPEAGPPQLRDAGRRHKKRIPASRRGRTLAAWPCRRLLPLKWRRARAWGVSHTGDARRQRAQRACHTGIMLTLPPWALEMAWVSGNDDSLPAGIDQVNLVLTRLRLAGFLAKFAEDKDVRDLLSLDLLGATIEAPFTSTGLVESTATLATRPFRLWEYVWLYKALGLAEGGLHVLDLGGPATHLSLLAALAGCRVTALDINPAFVQAAHECVRALSIRSLDARVGDMRDLSEYADESFDVVVSCSVLEHLTAQDQETALREVARVLKPGGSAGLTFDFGAPAPNANEHLPPPHEPPQTAAEAVRRYSQGGLVVTGNPFCEEPIPGSLFRDDVVTYTVASLFLSKPPVAAMRTPEPEPDGSLLLELPIHDLPLRAYRRVAMVRDMCARVAVLDAALGEARAQLERAVAAVEEKEQLIQRLHQEGGGLRRQLEQAVAKVRELHKALHPGKTRTRTDS